jgi:hypothetical protein
MKTVNAIFLLLLLTITQTPLGQLLKLPALIEHFYKHQRNDSVSLCEFLSDHYLKEHNDADRPEDEQLPFKTIVVQTIAVAIVPGIVKADLALTFDVPGKVMYSEIYPPQQHLCDIFHPPRM